MKKAAGICALAVSLPALCFLTQDRRPLPAAEPKESYSGAPAIEPAARPSVYVGARVCGECHEGQQAGNQMSRWLLSKHSRAYAVLARPESRRIAQLSGIPVEPQRSTMCLGCHSTGTFAEAAEKDDTFFAEDGVQCEMCHGPGSEHAEAQGTMDMAARRRAALPKLSRRDCMGCHKEKGSHTAVLKRPPLDMDKAWESIAHPMPPEWATHVSSQPPRPRTGLPATPPAAAGALGTSGRDAPRYTGVMACAQCHREANLGYQFSQWRTSAHARAYAALSSSNAYAMAEKAGVVGDPAQSPACLKCHATAFHDRAGGILETYAIAEGVGCEACHGAGSAYSAQATMRDKHAAAAAGLIPMTRQTCLRCHDHARAPCTHGQRPFSYETALAEIAHPTRLPPPAETPHYKTPRNLALRPDGLELYVTCEAAHEVIVVDTATRPGRPVPRVAAVIAVGHEPEDVTFSPDGSRAYVSHRLDDTLSVIDVATRKVIATVPVGSEPHGVLTDRSGKTLYVLNMTADSISVVDTSTLKEVKRLAASRSPWSAALTPDGSRMYVTNNLSRLVNFRKPPLSEVTVIDTETATVVDRVVVPQANLLQGIAWHPSGEFALFTLNRSKNLVPMTRLLQGWTITNGLGILWKDGCVDQILLDEPGMCFPDPTGMAITPDGRLALVTSSGSDRVGVVDIGKLLNVVKAASAEERARVLPNHLGKATEFVVAHIPTEPCPRGIVVAADNRTAYVACALDDSVSVLDLGSLRSVARIDLGGPTVISKARYGERIFNSANVCFHRQFSCHTCHPDGHIDGLTYNTEPGGIGVGPVDNRTLRGILDTAPFKWEGTNPTLSQQCGPRLAVFFTRIQPFSPKELAALDYYICTIPRPPNRYRPLGAPLTDTQRRGKAIFARSRTNDGREIPRELRCITCHFPPYYTDRERHDVGTMMWLDRVAAYDVPHLNNIYDSAPYLHNGIAQSLEEIWTKYNPNDRHGVTNDMTKDQLNDLIEFLKTL